MITIYSKLIALEKDLFGYITYVFECLEDNAPFGYKYKMVTRLPNWNHKDIEIGEIGYLTYKTVEAGKDSWYDRDTGNMIPYNYSNIYFVKFIKEVDNSKKDIIL